jgi:hypothetical protein
VILYVPANARRVAPFHVQLELLTRRSTAPERGRQITLRGPIVRLFRGTPILSLGDELSFDIWLCNPGGEPTGLPYVYYDDLVRLPYVETYLSGKPPDCDIVCYEFQFIPAPSDSPYVPADSADPDLYRQQALGHNLHWKRWWEFQQ